MQADAEHQQDHADLGELVGEPLIGHVAGGERPGEDAGEQITDERREAKPMRDSAEGECHHEADNDGGYQRHVMRHRLSFGRVFLGWNNPDMVDLGRWGNPERSRRLPFPLLSIEI
jgi:hypothetical protein